MKIKTESPELSDMFYDCKQKGVHLTILLTGASGFIGSRLLKELVKIKEGNQNDTLDSKSLSVRCVTRNKRFLSSETIKKLENFEIVEADLSKYEDCKRALENIDIAFYLVHSMEGSSRNWKKFSVKEAQTAENFSKAADECNVKRIIYLGGLTHGNENELSQHMLSRKHVGEILKNSKSSVTIFRAAVILGSGGGSFEMLRYLVERLPLMVCPKWVQTKCQPIFLDDVVAYLSKSMLVRDTEDKTFDIGGPDVLTYMDMMKIYARILGKSIIILIIPFLTPRLSSYWVDLVTPIKASLARPLIDSLKHEAIVKDDSIVHLIPLKLKSFEESLQYCLIEENRYKKNKDPNHVRKEKTSLSLNYKILLTSLILLLAIGTTYYFLNSRTQFLEPFWLSIAIIWYLLILFAIYFIRYGARLGALLAGILAWCTLAFWLFDVYSFVFRYSVIVNEPGNDEILRDVIGIIIASFTIISSHNIFHKIHIHG
ncbi:NAD(P)H-binding protein [Candidatus Nitrosocosmicus agrestis]|uniref:NAD(P)H-binding protein n=1 Tax=Candidatus Nitrosocosmicus agrestis TaxID=2563600 RepID=UPI00122DEF2A|nr:NAD(P)H-binding protein [Candidatus Nitrosocosmicus sp. SS]KAA2283283.1 NAD(P)H-binding protein [Candidatus Nitrosocosmicus sp. SS]KAF0868468.1 NAD-dependent epimerase/dehydratase family protein [Candidatus Nitrosocosmicus sp. SS]MDR4491872.1 NAD(P)H-binding protein [Candidatus Nitrosocosmicus sp.]